MVPLPFEHAEEIAGHCAAMHPANLGVVCVYPVSRKSRNIFCGKYQGSAKHGSSLNPPGPVLE